MTYTLDFDISLGSSKTGLTMAAQVVDTSGGNTGSEVTAGFTEIGTGTYLWHYASVPDDHRGGVKFYEDGVAGTILAFASINPEEAEYTGIVENGITFKSWTRYVGAALFGIVTGASTTNPKFRDTADGTDRIDATVDTNGNRTAITLDDS